MFSKKRGYGNCNVYVEEALVPIDTCQVIGALFDILQTCANSLVQRAQRLLLLFKEIQIKYE